jgi:hypothetical protein
MLRIEPALPILRIDPALPTLRIEPALPTLSSESTLARLPKLKRLNALSALAMLRRLRQLGTACMRCRLRPIAASISATPATRNESYKGNGLNEFRTGAGAHARIRTGDLFLTKWPSDPGEFEPI